MSGLLKFAVLLSLFTIIFMSTGPIGLLALIVFWGVLRFLIYKPFLWVVRTLCNILGIILAYIARFCLAIGTKLVQLSY